MGFRHCRSPSIWGSPSIMVTTATILLLLELSKAFVCYGHKAPSSWSSPFSLKKRSEPPTLEPGTPVLLQTISNQHRIAALVPRQGSGSKEVHRSTHHRLSPCVGYYIPSPTTLGSRRRNGRSTLFSKKRDEEDNGARDDGGINEEDFSEIEKTLGRNGNKRKGIISLFGDFMYGANCVNKDFFGLTWRVYSRTFVGIAPFLVLLFIVLPTWSSSSSPFLQRLATNVQGFMVRTFEFLAAGSRTFFVRPTQGFVEWILSLRSPRRTATMATQRSAWKAFSSSKSIMLWGLFWGPIIEEFIFRFVFRGLWKVLFRPVAFGPSTSQGRNSVYRNENKISISENSVSVATLPLLKMFSSFRRTTRGTNVSKPKYTNQSWRIASGICFGIAHFSNFFPIDPSKYTYNGELRLPSATVRERFMLGLCPGDFASQSANKEFLLTNMILSGAIYQAMHCCISTIILYGPLIDSSRSRLGGLLAAIGAHIAWNANVIFFVANLKMRALCKICFSVRAKMKNPNSNND